MNLTPRFSSTLVLSVLSSFFLSKPQIFSHVCCRSSVLKALATGLRVGWLRWICGADLIEFWWSSVLNHACICPQDVCCAPLPFFIGTPRIVYSSVRMQRCRPFEWDSHIFCIKRNKRLFYTLKTAKDKSKNIFFRTLLSKEFVTNMVISSTFVNSTFIMNVSITVRDFSNDTNQERVGFLLEKK